MGSESYEKHRERLLAAAVPMAAGITFVVTLAFCVTDFIANPRGTHDWVRNITELGLPLAAWFLARGPLRRHTVLLAICLDLAYTTVMATGIFMPANTISGTALFLSMKMVGTAILFPWALFVQCSSVTFTIVCYAIALPLSGRVNSIEALNTHQLIGPLIGGAFSVLGAFILDRQRRELFRRGSRLAESANKLQALLATERRLTGIARDLSVLQDRSSLLQRTNQIVVAAIGCEFSHALLFVPQEGELVAVSTFFCNGKAHPESAGLRFPIDEATRTHLAAGGVLVANNPAEATWIDAGLLRRFGIHRIALATLACKRGFAGVLATGSTRAAPNFTERELNLLSGIAAQAGIALDNARLFDEVLAANRMQNEFVANMSHELRTPLNVIFGYVDLLLDRTDLAKGKEARSFLQRIGTAARALHRLVESVLEYARLHRGGTGLLTRTFPADTLLDELRLLCMDIGAKPGVSLTIGTAPDLELKTDYNRLYSILSNLLLNAMKFTGRGEVILSVRREQDEVEFAVRDTGIGISPEQRETILQPFRQLDGSSTRSFGGVGLGLAIVDRNVKLLRGTLKIESTPGKGSCFVVRIPVSPTTGTGKSAHQRPTPTESPRP